MKVIEVINRKLSLKVSVIYLLKILKVLAFKGHPNFMKLIILYYVEVKLGKVLLTICLIRFIRNQRT